MAGSWAYAHLAMTLAKAGFWGYDYAEAVTYSSDGEMELDRVTEPEEPYDEFDVKNDPNQLKPAAENKDETIYEKMIRIKRSRPEACDRKVILYSIGGQKRKF